MNIQDYIFVSDAIKKNSVKKETEEPVDITVTDVIYITLYIYNIKISHHFTATQIVYYQFSPAANKKLLQFFL